MDPKSFNLIQPGKIRVRFAPSPTGNIHIGSVRTALFNYLFAQKNQGVFILRVEDTDLERSKKEYEENIIKDFKWLGVEWQEGPDIGGKYEPYRQSDKKNTYAKYLKKLLDEKKAYYCFCSEEELEDRKQYQLSIGEAPRYSGKCLNLPEETVQKYLKEKKPSVIRFKVQPKKIAFQDIIRGQVEFDASLMGDIIIAKNLELPLYNFCCVIDDFEMKITHIIRGEEHIPNTPKQILIYEAFNFPQPNYAHIPMILAPDKTKMSKRHGAISVAEYKKEGYLPEAIINFIAFLGWNPGTEREFYSMASLIKEFSLERIQKSAAIFNIKKLDYLNGFYIRQKSIEKLTELCLPYLLEAGLIKKSVSGLKIEYLSVETSEKISQESLEKIISLYQERLKKISEIPDLIDFFFKDNLIYEQDLLKWKDTPGEKIKKALEELKKTLSTIKNENWTEENLKEVLLAKAEEFQDRGIVLWPLRVALTGKKFSAGPFQIAEVIGKEKTLKRIEKALSLIF